MRRCFRYIKVRVSSRFNGVTVVVLGGFAPLPRFCRVARSTAAHVFCDVRGHDSVFAFFTCSAVVDEGASQNKGSLRRRRVRRNDGNMCCRCFSLLYTVFQHVLHQGGYIYIFVFFFGTCWIVGFFLAESARSCVFFNWFVFPPLSFSPLSPTRI